MDDASLISRQRVVRIPTAARQDAPRAMPVWAIVAASVLVTAVVLFFVFRGMNGGGEPTITTPVILDQAAESEVVYVTAIVTETPGSTEAVAEAVDEQPDEAVVIVVATETAAPTATTEPTTAPSPTLMPTSTTPPTPIPTNTSAVPTPCAIAVYNAFASTWNSHSTQLGCPTANSKSSISLAQEAFEGGRMIWRSDNDRIYVLYNSSTWASYADIWQEGDPSFACGTSESPPTPQRGFGKIWCTYDVVRQGLGNATEGEWADSGSVQDFNGGTILQTGNGRFYVFYSSGTWR